MGQELGSNLAGGSGSGSFMKLQSFEGIWAGGSPSKTASSHDRQTDTSFWQEASAPTTWMGLFIGLLEGPHNITAGFSQS